MAGVARVPQDTGAQAPVRAQQAAPLQGVGPGNLSMAGAAVTSDAPVNSTRHSALSTLHFARRHVLDLDDFAADEIEHVLAAAVVNVAAASSSGTKGESLLDTAHTLRALGADILVMRHGEAGAPYLVAERASCQVINAGDGWHAHPTQALLDLYTLRERLGGVAGRRIAIVGDVLHSRVARSDVWGFTRLGASVVLCGP